MTDHTGLTTIRPAVALHRAMSLSGHYEPVVTTGGPPTGPGWISYRQLTSAVGLRELTERAEVHSDARTPPERTAAAGLAVGEIASTLAYALTGTLCLDDGALQLDPDALAFRFGPDGVEALGVAEHGMRLSTNQTTREAMTATGYATLITPLIDGLGVLVRRGSRALWTDASDRLVTALFRNSHLIGLTNAPARAEALLAAGPTTLRHRIRLMEVSGNGETITWKRRAVCCLAYQTPRSAGSYCITCPHLGIRESACRVSAWLAGLTS